MEDDLPERLRKRAAIRRQIQTRKSVQEGAPDRIADLLEEAAAQLTKAEAAQKEFEESLRVAARTLEEITRYPSGTWGSAELAQTAIAHLKAAGHYLGEEK